MNRTDQPAAVAPTKPKPLKGNLLCKRKFTGSLKVTEESLHLIVNTEHCPLSLQWQIMHVLRQIAWCIFIMYIWLKILSLKQTCFSFLRMIAGTAIVHLNHRNFVRPSHGWISQKQCKLGSPYFHRCLPRRLFSESMKLFHKFDRGHLECGVSKYKWERVGKIAKPLD